MYWNFTVTVVGCFIYTGIFAIPWCSMFRRRHELLVKARFPNHLLLSSFVFFLVGELIFTQELLRQKGIHLPESVMLWTSCISLPLLMGPYGIRAARVLILTSADHRRTMLKYLTVWNQAAFLLTFLCFTTAVGVVLEVNRGRDVLGGIQYSYIFEPALFYLSTLVVFIAPIFKCCLLLFAVKDGLGVAVELVRGIVCLFGVVTPYLVIVMLRNLGVIKHVDTRIQFMMVFSITYINSAGLITSRRLWAKRNKSHCVKIHVGPSSMNREEGGGIFGDITSMSIVASSTLGPMYGRYVERHLCIESFSFLVETLKYRESTAGSGFDDVNLQFKDFDAIVQQYILPNSMLETNVGAHLVENGIVHSKEGVFKALSRDMRENIFSECEQEVSKLLDLNLLLGFMNTLEYKAATSPSAKEDTPQTFVSVFISTASNMYKAPSLRDLETEIGCVQHLL